MNLKSILNQTHETLKEKGISADNLGEKRRPQ